MKTILSTIFIMCLLLCLSCKTLNHLQKNFDGYVISESRADSMQHHLWELISTNNLKYEPDYRMQVSYRPKDLKKLIRNSVDKKKTYSIYFLPAAIRAEDAPIYETLTGYPGDSLINRVTTIVAINVIDKSSGKAVDPVAHLLINRLCPPPTGGCR